MTARNSITLCLTIQPKPSTKPVKPTWQPTEVDGVRSVTKRDQELHAGLLPSEITEELSIPLQKNEESASAL